MWGQIQFANYRILLATSSLPSKLTDVNFVLKIDLENLTLSHSPPGQSNLPRKAEKGGAVNFDCSLYYIHCRLWLLTTRHICIDRCNYNLWSNILATLKQAETPVRHIRLPCGHAYPLFRMWMSPHKLYGISVWIHTKQQHNKTSRPRGALAYADLTYNWTWGWVLASCV